MVTEKQWENFLEAMRVKPNVTKAAKKARIERTVVYLRRKSDPEFEKQFIDAKEIGIDAFEDDTVDRAEQSDLIRMFWLKANRPGKYGDKKDINLGGNVTVALNMVFDGQKD